MEVVLLWNFHHLEITLFEQQQQKMQVNFAASNSLQH